MNLIKKTSLFVVFMGLVGSACAMKVDEKVSKLDHKAATPSQQFLADVREGFEATKEKQFLNAINPKDKETVLIVALNEKDDKYVDWICAQCGLNKNMPGLHEGQTPLMRAVALNYAHGVYILLLIGADQKLAEFKCRRIPLHVAANQSDLAIVKMLVEDLEKQGMTCLLFQGDNFKRTPLTFVKERIAREHGNPSAETVKVKEYLTGQTALAAKKLLYGFDA